MAEINNKRQRRVQRLKRLIVIMLVMVFVIPVTISIVLAVQLHGLGKQVNELQAEIASMQIQLEEQKVGAADSQELTEEEASADVQTLENQNVWSESSGTTPADSGIHKVYLTFDDGPSANTDQILDILDEYGVKATFFVVGKEGYNDQYRRIVEEGHTLGMHSYSHVYRDIYESVEAYGQDLEKLHTYLYELTGVDSRIVRLPGGSSNTVSKDKIQDIIAYLGQQGMTYYDWNVSSGDAASGYVSAQQIADNVLNHVSEHHTSIVLMHDASGKNTTVEALPIILEKILESDNMVLLPITEDTVPIQHVQAQ
ncbi:MAG: polysaccharide deacetylase family protein [Lachnospiraceae bacterium]